MNCQVIGFVSCPTGKGREIAHTLVTERLAACVNVIPAICSIYLWKGNVEDEQEELLVIKTHSQKWGALEKRVKEIHPYELPEIICFSIKDGYAPYLEWLNLSVLMPKAGE